MNPAILRELLIFAGAITAFGIGSKSLIAIARRRPENASDLETKRQLREISQRLAGLENAMETAGLEIERIGEAHRFTARLLNDQHSPPTT